MAQSIKLNDNTFWDQSGIHDLIYQKIISINGGSSKSIGFPAGFRGIIFTTGVTEGAQTRGIYFVSCQGSGAVNYTAMYQATNVVLTTETNSLTITNNASQSTYGAMTVFLFGNTKTT